MLRLETVNRMVERQKEMSKPISALEKLWEKKCRIYSDQWGAYWRQSKSGYTYKKKEAGVFTFKDAYNATSHCGPEKHICFEFI